VGPFETADPVAEFLLRKKAAYCEYFASAAVLLLRAQGIPARYVKGVTVRAEGLVGGHFVVRESDAHAWVEAHLAETGWVEADPTPPADYATVHPGKRPGALEEAWESLRARVAAAWATLRQGGWAHVTAWIAGAVAGLWATVKANPWVAAAVLLAIVFASGGLGASVRLIRLWLSRRRQRVGPGAATPRIPSELWTLLQRVERFWTHRGHARPATRGLREHMEALPREALTPSEREVSAAVVDAYYRASFGSHAPSDVELADLSVRVAPLR
jgi:hypothetical protein